MVVVFPFAPKVWMTSSARTSSEKSRRVSRMRTRRLWVNPGRTVDTA